MEAEEMKNLKEYVEKHLKAYKDGGISERELNEDIMMLSNDYGFISDHGVSFDEKYCNNRGVPVNDAERLELVLSKVTDITDVGSLYVSWWREVTHFMEGNPFSEQHSKEFIVILERLAELTEGVSE